MPIDRYVSIVYGMSNTVTTEQDLEIIFQRNSIMLKSVKSTNSMQAAQLGLGAIAIIL